MTTHLFHIGMDSGTTSGGFLGPIFKDQTFEYISVIDPYQEYDTCPTYRMLKARNRKHGDVLADFLPRELWNVQVHLDPSFPPYTKYSTYGEPTHSWLDKRAINVGDVIFFIASLAAFNDNMLKDENYQVYGKRRELYNRYQKGRMNKYLIGFLNVAGIFEKRYNEKLKLSQKDNHIHNSFFWEALQYNAHYRREKEYDENHYYKILIGNKKSRLLKKAIPLTKGLISKGKGFSFELNSFGRKLLKIETSPLRFPMKIADDSLILLKEKICNHR